MAAPLGEHREPAVLEDAQLADDAVAASVHARAARAEPQLPALDPQRVLQLERLDGRRQRVRHGDVDAARAVGIRTGALTAAHRLVVREAVVAEREVVHRPLARGGHGNEPAERREHDVDDARGGLRVAGDDGGGRGAR